MPRPPGALQVRLLGCVGLLETVPVRSRSHGVVLPSYQPAEGRGFKLPSLYSRSASSLSLPLPFLRLRPSSPSSPLRPRPAPALRLQHAHQPLLQRERLRGRHGSETGFAGESGRDLARVQRVSGGGIDQSPRSFSLFLPPSISASGRERSVYQSDRKSTRLNSSH